MNFIQAFDKVNKPAAAPATSQFMQANISQDNKSFMNDDMKSYIDAKFEALKTDLLEGMSSSNKGTNTTVETPQEPADNPNNNINEGGNDNASSTDL